MPCLEITVPKLESKIKERVAVLLTEAFASATPFGSDIFGIRFFEYSANDVAIGGKLLDERSDKIYLHFLLYCPRLKRSAKQKLILALTDAFTKATENENWKPVIHICEHPYDNVGVDGKLLSDAYEACANRNFYYDLPKD